MIMAVALGAGRDAFIQNNMGLVHACAHRFTGKGIEYDDLFQAGCVGLVKASDNFEPERGLQFSTYAVPVILGEIKRLFREGGTVKVSRRLKEISMRAARETAAYVVRHGEEPGVKQLAELVECSEELLVEALCAARPSLSLTCDDEEESRTLDIPIEGEEESIAEKLSLNEAIAQLDERERRILSERFCKNKTQSQTASLLDTTQVQISRTERKIILKLRNLLEG